MDCLFCNLPKDRIILENDNFLATPDKYPKQEGHSLIIAKRHISSIFEMNEAEAIDLLDILHTLKAYLEGKYQPDGYNIGTNMGKAAGQSIMHFHLHVIPRYQKDRLGQFFG